MSATGKSREFRRQSWKGDGTGDVDPRAARRVRRVVGTIAALCLLAWFAWLLWPRPVAVTHVFCAAVDDYDVLQAPPLPFASETIGEFEPLGERSGVSLHRPDIKTAKAIGDLFASQLPHGPSQNDDLVLVYLAVHGVSQSDGEGGARAWLLGSDYGALRDAGKVAIDDVLSSLQACPARAKVLVLDAGSIESDPALGMAVNEFPALLAEKVSQLPGDDVWVLLSHRLFEKSHAAFADRRSVFGYYVARGLDGGPEVDRDANGVDLGELFDYVRDNVARYVWHASGRQETQTPTLLARSGDLTKAHELKLTSRRPAEPAEAAKGTPQEKSEEKSEKKTARLMPAGARWDGLALAGALAAEPGAPAAEKSPPATAEAEQGKKAAQSSDASDQPPAERTEAEKKVDAKEGSATTKEPEDPAIDPTLKALRDEWLECQRRCDRSKARWTPVDYAPRDWLRHIEQLRGYELQWLFGASSISANRIARVGSEIDWDALQRRFDESRAKSGFEQHPTLEAAVQLRDDLLFALRYYAAWSAGDASADDCLSLAEGLGRLLRVLNEPPGSGAGNAQTTGTGPWLAELAAIRDELAAAKRQFDDRIDKEVRECLASKDEYNGARTERVLRLPWIAGDDRAKLLQYLQRSPRLEDDLPPPPSEAQSEQRARQLEQDGVRRAGRLARIQGRLFQMAGSQESESDVDERANRLEQSGRFDSSAARGVGFALSEAYRRRNHDVGSAASEALRSADDGQAVRLVENQVRLADVRDDVDLTDKSFWDVPFPPLATDWKPNLVATAPGKEHSEASLRTDTDTEVSWRIANPPPGPVDVTWSLDYDASLLTVAGKTKGSLHLNPNATEAERTLSFPVRAKREQEQPPTTSLTLRVQAQSAAPQTSEIAVTLPRWQPIELAVVETDGLPRPNIKDDERGIQKVVLMPLPSGKTLFHLELRNPSPRERKVKYRFFALSKAGMSARSLALWPLRPGGEWQPNGKAIQPAPIELTLAPKGKARLSFPPFPQSPPSEAPAPAPPAKPQAPMPEAPKGIPIGDGLVCELTDLSSELPAASQRFWIDVVPLHPRHYVIPSVRYNTQKQRIELAVRPRFPGRLPSNGSIVRWYSEGLEGGNLNPISGALRVEQRELSLPSPPIEASNSKQAVHVLVDVDGYTRAFRYEVRRDRPTGEAPETESADVAFLTPPSEPPTWLKNGTPIDIKLRADMPRGWFEQPGHFIQVGIERDARQTAAFDSDRRCDAILLPAENDGDFLVETRVDELQAELRTDAYPDQEIMVIASLGSTADSVADQRTVGLDGNAPVIRPVTPRPIYEGAEVVLSIVATDDRSGVDKVEAAVDVDDTGQVKQWGRASENDKSPGTYTIKLPTKDLAPRRWIALVQAKDRAGNTTGIERVPFVVVAKPGPTAGGAKKTTTHVDATVTFNSRAGSDFRGKYTGPKSGTVKADRNGRFSLDLPPGGYKFEFEGVVNNTKVKFAQELAVDPPGDKPQQATLAGP